jgi:aspartate ammonia-lyase
MADSESRYRTERDLLGDLPIAESALWGIHTARAIENFPLALRPIRPALIHGFGLVKLACALTNEELGFFSPPQSSALIQACQEMAAGELDQHLLVDALQGGAGTSTNMNVNEVLANRALQILGQPLGSYDVVSPHDHVNLHQSTNDTYPTALRVAAIALLRGLADGLVALMEAFQSKEQELADVVKVGRTELQDAVLITMGREMGAYAEALGRDRWRICKCEERLRSVNLGGTAVGTGLGAPRQFIFRVVDRLREVSGFGISRAENLLESTQNADVFVEVSGMLRCIASNLAKICGDLRLLSSGPDAGLGEIRLPPRQAGSSIMPGKVNPVIPEAVTQAALQVLGSDQIITLACSLGSLELNPFLPLVAEHLLGSIELLTRAVTILREHCVVGIEANRARCAAQVQGTTAMLTALTERIGYRQAQTVATLVSQGAGSVRELVVSQGLLSESEYERLTSAEALNRLGSAGQDR